jgi:hypothetical protein
MPFNSEQLAYGAKAAIDFYLKNDPVDQINISHPFLKKMTEGKQEYAGGKQYVVEQLRFSNDSNFQPYFGDSEVDYNRKRTLNQANFSYGSWHDGFGLNEDELVQNGIAMTDDRNAEPSGSEKVQLTNLIKENTETLKLGFQENFDLMLHRDGAQNPLDIPGLDALVSISPTAGTIGGLAASNAWWQNYAAHLDASAEGMLEGMERAWRACIRYGGNAPDFILAGSDFVDEYRDACGSPGGAIQRQVIVGGSSGNKAATTLDGSVGSGLSTGLYFKGIEIIWDPTFDVLDAADTPTVRWSTRCYFLNTKFLKLRPISGQWMIPRRPPRVYNRYVHYWGLTAKAALTTSKRNAHAVVYI